MMPSGILDSLSSSFSVTEATAGLLVTAWAGTIALTSIPLVRATLRLQRRSIVLATLTVLATVNLATALAPSYGSALAARVVAAAHGLFWAVVIPYATSLVQPVWAVLCRSSWPAPRLPASSAYQPEPRSRANSDGG